MITKSGIVHLSNTCSNRTNDFSINFAILKCDVSIVTVKGSKHEQKFCVKRQKNIVIYSFWMTLQKTASLKGSHNSF